MDTVPKAWQHLFMTETEELETIEKALADVKASAADVPKVASVQSELYVDSNGHDAARINVVLEDRPGGLYSWKELQPLYDAIFEAFQRHKIDRWPFINFRLKSELTEESEEESGAPA